MHDGCDNIHDLLRRARMMMEPADPDEDALGARAAITAESGPTGLPAPRAAGHDTPAATVAPDPYPTAAAQAEHELDVVSALVLNAPEAAASLRSLVEGQRIDPEGALVFSALLHVAARHDAARFWWQFAAGGGSATAAYCLHLDHQRRGEFHDAAHWHDQATRPPQRTTRARPSGTPADPLLPESICHALLAQSYDGASPHLPGIVAAVIDNLMVHTLDEYGDVPQPTVEFTHRLSRVS